VHAIIGTGREEKVGSLVACLAARDARGALAAFDAATAGGADPGGVLEQVMAALRDSLLASVGCGEELMLQGAGLGVDLAAIGQKTGTVTLLAMLQIIDHALARMRLSGHAAVLAEMAIVRLASLEDLDALAEAVERLGAAGPTAAGGQAAPRIAARTALVAPSAEPLREKKTTDLIPPGEPVVAQPLTSQPAPPQPAVSQLTPLDAWRRSAMVVGGLAVDFAEMAHRAEWRDDVLEVVMPHAAGNAASFLRRPEIAARLMRALTDMVGRPVRHSLLVDTAPPSVPEAAPQSLPQASAADTGPAGPQPRAAERGKPPVSQAAMLREAAEHPLVVHVRTLFDAAVRKVDPPRARPTAPAAEPTVNPGGVAAVADGDESDQTTPHDDGGGEGDGGIDG